MHINLRSRPQTTPNQMSVIQNNLIGRARGSVGNITMSTWKGLNVMKNKASSVANPRSDGQVSQRSAMSQMVAIARQILSVLQVSFREMAVHMSAYNAFTKFNLDEAFTRSGPVATFVASALKVAKGTLGDLLDFTKVSLTSRTLDVTWTDNSGTSGSNASDAFYVVITSADGLNVVAIRPGDVRSDAASSIVIPGSWSLTGARCCGYFVKADHSQSCDSVNIAV